MRHARGRYHDCHAAPSQGRSLSRGPLPSHAFVHHRTQRFELTSNPFDQGCILHVARLPRFEIGQVICFAVPNLFALHSAKSLAAS